MLLRMLLIFTALSLIGCKQSDKERVISEGTTIAEATSPELAKTPEISAPTDQTEIPECILTLPRMSPTIDSLPPWIGYVEPYPGSCYTLSAYLDSAGASSYYELNGPGICFAIGGLFFLMEPGDFPTTEQFLSRYHLIVDGKFFEKYHYATEFGFSFERLDPNTGEPLWRIPEGLEGSVCFEVPLDPGEHEATLIYEYPSAKSEEYTWMFTLAPTDSVYVTPDVEYFQN